MSDENKHKVQADNNSIAFGSISAGGDISGNIHIGNVYQTPEDDLPLSSDEIENGLTRFAQFLPERAPVLQDSFSSIDKKLRATLGADQKSLSPALKAQREDGVNRMKLLCMEVMDISFRAICLGQNPPPYDSRPPFLGLFAFRPEDREFFFGRDALVQKLVARIKAHPFLAVLGASGSGKSSLVMAGLVPALEAEMSYLTPSSSPLSQLLTAKESASAKTVFIVDQFEELFTHPHDAAERADFIHALLGLTKTNRVVITMRADFWGEVAIYTDLKQAMQEHQELIAPMNVDELHSAMEQQAAVVGLRFDPTLSESILAEVKGEPGAMPLLQHALWELWNRRHGLWIKAEEYQAFGGVKQAIASTAEEVYASCSDFERARVRDIFLRLTRLDESGEGRDTRRRVLIDELIPINSDSSVTINLLNKLADARLIVKTDKDVEVAHEALIRHWERLRIWLNEDREGLQLHDHLSDSAHQWESRGREVSELYRGTRLRQTQEWMKNHQTLLNPLEGDFLKASLAELGREHRVARLRWIALVGAGALILLTITLALTGNLNRFIYRPVDMEDYWVTIAAGEFQMGSENGENDEKPAHTVYLDEFQIGRYEVTNRQYDQCVRAGICREPSINISSIPDPAYYLRPVTHVHWYSAVAYCKWVHGRLPTEAEWEKAASWNVEMQTKFVYPWGNSAPIPDLLNFNGNVGGTTPVGTYPEGENKLFDMAGNVMEWTSSLYQPYPYNANDGREDMNTYNARVLRGGAFDYLSNQFISVRSADRFEEVSASTMDIIGFRCARYVP